MLTELLKMIETVDPSDTAKLDEIDARVHEYLGFQWHGDGVSVEHKLWAGHWGFDSVKEPSLCNCETQKDFAPEPKEYTRSRDALKAIRPDGLTITLFIQPNGAGYQAWVRPTNSNHKPYPFESETDLKTEELAELHAILQAIEYEREQP